jgi:hypothetical protein
MNYILISAHKHMKYTVCGLETIDVNVVNYKLSYEFGRGSSASGTNTTYYINSAEFEQFMVSSDPDCPLYKIDLVHELDFDPSSSSTVIGFNSTLRPQLIMETWGTNSNFNLRIETTDSFTWETYYFRGSSQSNGDTYSKNAYIELKLQMIDCSLETIDIKNNNTWTEVGITQFASKPQTVNINSNNFKFKSSHPDFCPITHYEVTKVTDSSGSVVSDGLNNFKMGDPTELNANNNNYFEKLMIYDTNNIYSNYWVHVRAYQGTNSSAEAIVARVSVSEGQNFAPLFKGDLETQTIDLNSANSFVQYTLPEAFDPNDHEISMVVGELPKFGTFDLETKTFTFKGITLADIGEYEISVTLIDEKLMENSYTFVVSVINSVSEFVVPIDVNKVDFKDENKKDKDSEDKPKVEHPKVTAEIVELSSFGVVNISFSENLFVNSTTNLTWIDDSVISLHLEPFFIPEDISPSMFAFTWQAIRFEKNMLDLKINFTNPVYISLS